MELVDAETEENIPGTAYQITIEKFADKMLLLDEAFHIMNDSDKLVVNFETTESGDLVVKGQKMGETLGYMADDANLVMEGPVFVGLGLYRFTVDVVAIEGETLDADKRAIYEALVILAESKRYFITYDGEEHSLQVISYFDNIVDLEFDTGTKYEDDYTFQLAEGLCRAGTFVACRDLHSKRVFSIGETRTW